MTETSGNNIGQLPPEITPSTLKDWLEAGIELKIIDIRTPADFKYWHIEESENVVAYDELHRGRPGQLESFESDVPVVTVCYSGNTSQAATQYLRSKGINATSLIGGMQLWNMAWNTADVEVPNSEITVIQVRRVGKGCLSYIVASQGVAAVIDPSLDPEIYIKLAGQHSLNIERVIDTHIHSDHVSRGRILAEMTDGTYMLPQDSEVSFQFEPIQDGDVIIIGGAAFRPMQSPGHTPESMSLLLDETHLFSGDSIVVDGVGRPASSDLNPNLENIKSLAIELAGTIKIISKLDPNVTILPTHSHKPIAFDGIAISEKLSIFLGNVPDLTEGVDSFVEKIISSLPLMPRTHYQIIQFNQNGNIPRSNIAKFEAGENHAIIQFNV